MERLRHAARWPARDLPEPDGTGPPQRPASRPLLSARASRASCVVLAACIIVLAALGAWLDRKSVV